MNIALDCALLLLLCGASACDLRTRRIPNGLVAAGLLLGLAGRGWHGGEPGLLWSLCGVAAALPLLPLWAARALGAGDVKLLMMVGALMGPVFLLWTALGTLFAGALLGLFWMARRSAQMPLAPAIALGAGWAFAHLQGGLL